MSESPLLQRPGAVAADPPDQDVAGHYGSLAIEQRQLAAGDAVVDLSHRDVVTISGADRLTWLHSLCTQELEHLAPGQPTAGYILSPQGRIEHAFAGIDDGATFWAHTEPGAGSALAGFLDSMRFMMRVEVALRVDHAVLGLGGGQWRIVERAELADVGALAGLWAWEAERIAAGRVRVGRDTDDKTLPNEVGLDDTVALDKGCYRGQETVARVHTLGRPPRRLVRLHLDGSADRLPAEGSSVTLDGAPVGFIGTSARHHEWGPIALAMVKRSIDPAAQFIVDGVAASQEIIVDPEVGLHVRPRLGA